MASKDETVEPKETVIQNPSVSCVKSEQSNQAEDQASEKKNKNQQKKKTIGSWNSDNTKSVSITEQDIKNESVSEDFPSLGGIVKQEPKQKKAQPEISKEEDSQQTKPASSGFYQTQEKETDFPSLNQISQKVSNQDKSAKHNQQNDIKPANKQQNSMKQESKKTLSNWNQISKDTQKNSGGSGPKYLEDFPSL